MDIVQPVAAVRANLFHPLLGETPLAITSGGAGASSRITARLDHRDDLLMLPLAAISLSGIGSGPAVAEAAVETRAGALAVVVSPCRLLAGASVTFPRLCLR